VNGRDPTGLKNDGTDDPGKTCVDGGNTCTTEDSITVTGTRSGGGYSSAVSGRPSVNPPTSITCFTSACQQQFFGWIGVGGRGRPGDGGSGGSGGSGTQSGTVVGSSRAVDNGDEIIVTATRSFSYIIWPWNRISFFSSGSGPCASSVQQCEPERFAVRLQAQGGRPPIEESVVLISTLPITVAMGIIGLEELQVKLTRRELKQRSVPFARAEIYIARGPASGGIPPSSKSFYALGFTNIRVDVEVLAGVNFRY